VHFAIEKSNKWEQPVSLFPIDSCVGRPAPNAPADAATNNEDEPPSRVRPSNFLLGQDGRGHWVAQNKSGTRGGLFVNRAQALRYIRFEGGDDALVTLTGALELNLARMPQAQPDLDRSTVQLVAA